MQVITAFHNAIELLLKLSLFWTDIAEVPSCLNLSHTPINFSSQITQKSELLQRSTAEVAAEEARLKGEKQQIDQAEMQQVREKEEKCVLFELSKSQVLSPKLFWLPFSLIFPPLFTL